MAQKGTKFRNSKRMCIVCGKEFEGVASASTCGGGCRIRLARLKEANKKPEYMLLAKSKGQKIPDLSAPKRPRLAKGETLQVRFKPPQKREEKIETIGDKIDYAETTIESYDGAKISASIVDEMALVSSPTPLTWEQKFAHNDEINKKIKDIRDGKLPPGTHPRTFKLQQDDLIADLEKKILK